MLSYRDGRGGQKAFRPEREIIMNTKPACRRKLALALCAALLLTLMPGTGTAGSCNHPNPRVYGETVACSERIDNGDGTHTRVLTNCIVYECPDCGQTWEVWGAEYSREREPHKYNGDTCWVCGHKKTCSHSNWSVVGGDEKYVSCRDNGDGTHTETMIEYMDCRCDDCGYTWSTTENRTYREEHQYLYGQNTCNICGARKPGSSPVTPPAPRPGPSEPAGQLVPDSGSRRMTESECWNWTYEALGYVYHEILARHGFVFDASGTYAWYFNSQSWYRPISSRNNQAVYDSLNETEWYNINLIKEVRQKMKNQGTDNPGGRPAPSRGGGYVPPSAPPQGGGGFF